MVGITYIRFYAGMKVQGIDRKTLPYYTNLQPYAAWYGVIGTFTICFVRLNFSTIDVQRLNVDVTAP